MADYRFAAQVISRSQGRSATAAAAYRSGGIIADTRTGEVHDYTRKGGVEWTGIAAPENAPVWAKDREKLWNLVEQAEKRRDAQLAREVQLSLPHELNFQQRRALVCAFVEQEFVARGMIADIAMHQPDRGGDARNFHVHIMLTTRQIGPEGFGKKNRDWNSREELFAMRESWAALQNAHLRDHFGAKAPQVTHLSYAERGIEKVATVHLGPIATGMERQGIQTMLGDHNRDAERRNQSIRQSRQRMAEIERSVEGRTERSFGFVAMEARIEARRLIVEKRNAELALEAALKRKAEFGRPPGGRELEAKVLAESKSEVRILKARLRAKEKQGRELRKSAKNLSRWVTNPARMIWLKIAELHARDRLETALRQAESRVRVREQWLQSAAGKAWVAGESKTVERRAARLDERRARRHIRSAERKISQAQTLGQHADALAGLTRMNPAMPSGIPLPENPISARKYLAEMSAGIQATVKSLAPDLQTKLTAQLSRGRGRGD
jgi:hypothetical protein